MYLLSTKINSVFVYLLASFSFALRYVWNVNRHGLRLKCIYI